jgi:hypothetical protein
MSPVRSETNISSLANALTSAKKEIEAQSMRVRDLEALLTEERRAREQAEERANKLERESPKEREVPDPTVAEGDNHVPPKTDSEEETKLQNGSASSNMADVATARLQLRLDTMLSDMDEMKQQIETYRRRAEDAEAESAMHRKSLAEMVEKIREDDARKASKAAKRQSRSDSDLSKPSSSPTIDGSEEEDDAEEGEITIINEKDMEGDSPGALLRRVVQNGRATSHQDMVDSTKLSPALATRQSSRNDLAVAHGAPAVSILTVVALGVAVMAYLNSYPKIER